MILEQSVDIFNFFGMLSSIITLSFVDFFRQLTKGLVLIGLVLSQKRARRTTKNDFFLFLLHRESVVALFRGSSWFFVS